MSQQVVVEWDDDRRDRVRDEFLIMLICAIVVCVDTVIVVHVMVGGGAIISTMMSMMSMMATTPTKLRLSNELQDRYDPDTNCDVDDGNYNEYHRCRRHDDVL